MRFFGNKTGGYIRIIIAAIIWGSLGTVVRLIHLPVLVIVFYRVFFATTAILVYVVVRRKINNLSVGRNLYLLVLMGVLLAINWSSFFYSVKLTTVANAVLITYTAPIFVAILAPLILKEKLERITILTLTISLVGAALIAAPSIVGISKGGLSGIVWASVSAITYAILVILAKPLTGRVAVSAMIFYEEFICAIILSPALFVYRFNIGFTTMLILFVIGAFNTALAAGLYLSGLREVKAQQVGVFTYLDPVSAVVFAAIFLGEIPGFTTIAGGVLIIISGLILVLVTRERVQTEVVSE